MPPTCIQIPSKMNRNQGSRSTLGQSIEKITKQYPESTETITKGPFTIGSSTQKINLRARGRQARIKVSCESTGTKWRWGSVRVGIQPDGGR